MYRRYIFTDHDLSDPEDDIYMKTYTSQELADLEYNQMNEANLKNKNIQQTNLNINSNSINPTTKIISLIDRANLDQIDISQLIFSLAIFTCLMIAAWFSYKYFQQQLKQRRWEENQIHSSDPIINQIDLMIDQTSSENVNQTNVPINGANCNLYDYPTISYNLNNNFVKCVEVSSECDVVLNHHGLGIYDDGRIDGLYEQRARFEVGYNSERLF